MIGGGFSGALLQGNLNGSTLDVDIARGAGRVECLAPGQKDDMPKKKKKRGY
jgi:hypothetical protein